MKRHAIIEMYFNDGKIKIHRVGQIEEDSIKGKTGSNGKFDYYYSFFDTEKELNDYVSRAKEDQGSCLTVV